MTYLGFLGLLAAFAAVSVAYTRSNRTNLTVFALVWAVHVLASFTYYLYVQDKPADSHHYYYDYYGIFDRDFQLNTYFLVWLVQSLKSAVGGTYLDYFFVFQAFGFWGIALLMRVFDEIWQEVGLEPTWLTYALLFFPGVHFWTSAIGKDAPMFLAVALMLWSSMHLTKRWLYFLVGLLLMTAIRPYAALLALSALSLAALTDRRRRLSHRLLLLVLGVGGAAVAASTVQMTFGLDVTDATAVGEYVTEQQDIAETVEGGSNVLGASYPEKVLSLLYRPFFVDAEGPLGLVASLENLLLLIGTVVLALRWRVVLRLVSSIFFLRYAVALAVLMIAVFSLLYYNIGLGLRQKVMFMPMLITLFVAVLAVSRARQFVPHYQERRSLA